MLNLINLLILLKDNTSENVISQLMDSNIKIFSGRHSVLIAEKIAKSYGLPLGKIVFNNFSDGELRVAFEENIRNEDVFIIQSTNPPASNVLELLFMLDAARRASARRVIAVVPYFGYARQDRKVAPRTSISAKVVANLLTNAGANRIVTVDLHAGQIQGFFDMPVDNLFTTPLFSKFIKKKISSKKLICVSPDMGGVARTRALATRLKADLAIIDKRRPAPGKSQVMNVIGNVKDKTCIIIDDIIDSGGTIVNAAQALINRGAKEVHVYITHGVLSGEAVDKIKKSKIKKLVITDTIDNHEKTKNAH